jgi:transcriptional regulator with XRE-family HTH domain
MLMVAIPSKEDIAAIRQARGMNLREFGDLLGVSEATASRWESGDRHPQIETLIRLGEMGLEYGLKIGDARKREPAKNGRAKVAAS